MPTARHLGSWHEVGIKSLVLSPNQRSQNRDTHPESLTDIIQGMYLKQKPYEDTR